MSQVAVAKPDETSDPASRLELFRAQITLRLVREAEAEAGRTPALTAARADSAAGVASAGSGANAGSGASGGEA
jgi:hypothetical protein